MLNAHRLHLLVELRRRGTITDVAKALSYSVSTISSQLAQLEKEAGSRLIEPVGRRVRLTTAGEMLADHAEQILIMVNRAEADLARTRTGIAGVLRAATFQTAAIGLVPPLLRELRDLHPELVLQLSEIQPDTATSVLLAHDFDLVVGEAYPGLGPTRPTTIDQRQLLADPLRCYAPTEWVSQGSRLEELAHRPWVLEPPGKPARAWAESMFRAAGFEPVVRFESADLLVQVTLVESGHAAALLPDLVWAARHPRAPLLRLPDDPVRQVYTAVRIGTEHQPTLVELRHVLSRVSESVMVALHDLLQSPPLGSPPAP